MTRSFLLIATAAAAIAAAALVVRPAEAQEQTFASPYTNLTTYAVSLPIGDTRRFVSDVSWIGVTWEGQWPDAAHDHTVVGFALGLQDYFDRSRGTRNYDWGATTGTEFRDLVVTTLLGTGRWYPRGTIGRGPFLGFGAGGIYAQQSYQLGVMSQIQRSAFHVAIAPEAGVAIPMWDGIDAVVHARYMLPNAGGHYLGGGSRSFRSLTIGVGLAEH